MTEREDMLDTIRELARQLKLRELVSQRQFCLDLIDNLFSSNKYNVVACRSLLTLYRKRLPGKSGIMHYCFSYIVCFALLTVPLAHGILCDRTLMHRRFGMPLTTTIILVIIGLLRSVQYGMMTLTHIHSQVSTLQVSSSLCKVENGIR